MALYNSIGRGYVSLRQPGQRIASVVDAAQGDAVTVANFCAGAGSYEPPRPSVLAVEPSKVMIQQRPVTAAACLRGSGIGLPRLDAFEQKVSRCIVNPHARESARKQRLVCVVVRSR